jgi:NAD(P) transhydrogenase subunit alpha
MKLGIIKEKTPHEKRVALTPDVVEAYIKLGLSIEIEAGAGVEAGFADELYTKAGAKVTKNAASILKSSDIILRVQAPKNTEITAMKPSSLLVGLLGGISDTGLIKKLAAKKISAFSMELIPRITRAQSMDVLSSQSNLAGYRAVIDAIAEFPKAIPMMITAAGRINPANVLVLGAGVAGLQAIATAKRMGAVVSAFDVRPAAREQVESLGASFVEVASQETAGAETAGGYAKEMSEEYKKKQSKLIHDTLKNQDIVICTALIPGRTAPVLITEKMVKDMKAGSVIVDLAVASGGNCETSQSERVVKKHGVTIIGHTNMPSRVAPDASRLYAKNVLNFVSLLINTKLNKIKLDFEDQIIQNALLTHDGKIVHPQFKGAKTNVGPKPSDTASKRDVGKSSSTVKPKRGARRKST